MISIVRKGKINICKMTLGTMATNTYVVYGENGEGFIVDPAAESEIIKIKTTELMADIKAILLTHGHFDHIGALEEVKKIYDADVYACEKEKEILFSSEKNLSAYFEKPFTGKADVYVKDGESISIAGFDIRVIETPGHTIGSVCYLVSKEDEQVLISGDTLFAGSHGRYDFPTGSYSQLMISIKEKLLTLKDSLPVYPGHNEDTTIGEEKALYL